MYKLVIPGERPISWNTLYSGKHWSKRSAIATEKHLLVRSVMPEDASLFSVPVDITVTAYFKNRPQDPDNISSKLYIDGLIGYIILDDSPRWVNSVTTKSRVDRDYPRVEILIKEHKDGHLRL